MFKRSLRFICAIAVLLNLTGCATYFENSAKNHCYNQDWFASGFDAGKRGQQLRDAWIDTDARCEKYNLWSNKNEYERGYKLGRDAFCTAENGFEFGKRDRNYYPICDSLTQSEFNRAYRDGQQLYDARQEYNYNQSEIRKAVNFIDYTYERRRKLAKKIKSDDVDDKTKQAYERERCELEERREETRYKLDRYRSASFRLEARLKKVEQQMADYYDLYDESGESYYSMDQSIESENQIIDEPTIIAYRVKSKDKDRKRIEKDNLDILSDHIRAYYSRSFRFQVLKSGNLLFVHKDSTDQNKRDLAVDLNRNFGDLGKIVFWSPRSQLKTVPLTDDIQELIRATDAFINTHARQTRLQNSTAIQAAYLDNNVKVRAVNSRQNRIDELSESKLNSGINASINSTESTKYPSAPCFNAKGKSDEYCDTDPKL